MDRDFFLYATSPVKVGAKPGATLYKAIEQALELSKQLKVQVVLSFNGSELDCDFTRDTAAQVVSNFYGDGE